MGLSGKLEDLSLADIFQILSIGKKSGTLFIKTSSDSAGVIFRNGLVTWADSDTMEQSLSEELLGTGKIRSGRTSLIKGTEGGGDVPPLKVLVDNRVVGVDEIERAAKKRIEQVVYKLLLHQEGDFNFEPDRMSFEGTGLKVPEWELRKGLSPEYLIMEGARAYDEIQQYGRILSEEMEGVEEGEDWPGVDDTLSPEMLSLRALTQELRFPETPAEISLLLLRYASDIFERAVLFIIHENHLAGFGQFGLEGEQPDERVREIFLDYRQSEFLVSIFERKIPYRGMLPEDPVTKSIVREIGGRWPGEAALYPVIAEGEVVALLYCDNQPSGDDIPETPGLEIFVTQAGLALEKAMLKKKLSERGE